MASISDRHLDAVERLATELDGRDVTWALTGSTSFALQGVPVSPNDVDVQTTEDGAYAVEEAFADHVVDPVSLSETEAIRSHFGALGVDGVRVEVMGAVQKPNDDGTWGEPTDIADHRRFVACDGRRIPVLSLAYEADAYERLGRTERAELLAECADR